MKRKLWIIALVLALVLNPVFGQTRETIIRELLEKEVAEVRALVVEVVDIDGMYKGSNVLKLILSIIDAMYEVMTMIIDEYER